MVTPDPTLWREPNFNPAGFPEMINCESMEVVHTNLDFRGLTPARAKCRNEKLRWFLNGCCRRVTGTLKIEPEIGWRRPLGQALKRLAPGSFDVIVASGGPFISFPVAAEFSRRTRKPLVLDYRDFWSQNPHLPILGGPINRFMEHRALAHAAGITTVSPSYAEALKSSAKKSSDVEVMTNGFDPEEAVRVENADPHGVVYLGTLYPPIRDLQPIFLALRHLSESGFKFQDPDPFLYYGTDHLSVKSAAKAHGVDHLVRSHSSVPRVAALQIQASSKLAVVLVSNRCESSVAEKGILTGKIFELIGLGTQTLVIAPQDADVRKVAKDVSYVQFAAGREIERIASIIAQRLSLPANRSRPADQFSWERIAQEYSKFLSRVISKHPRDASC